MSFWFAPEPGTGIHHVVTPRLMMRVAEAGHIIPVEQPAAFSALLGEFLASAFPSSNNLGAARTRETTNHA